MENKLEHLKEYLKGLGSVAVAFSSGVDSTFLLKVAHDVLGDKAIAITAQSCSFPKRELNEAKAFCEKEGIQHVICQSEELEIEGFSKNPPNRCYLCKKELFEKIGDIAKKNGIEYIAEGSNMDDNGDYRPGLIAVKELGVKSPLREAKLTATQLAAAKKQVIGQLGVSGDNREGLFLGLGKSFLHYNRYDTLPEVFAKVEKLTAGEIREVANEIFAPERLFSLIYQ